MSSLSNTEVEEVEDVTWVIVTDGMMMPSLNACSDGVAGELASASPSAGA
jgi:hypothetical protein